MMCQGPLTGGNPDVELDPNSDIGREAGALAGLPQLGVRAEH
jgi:hypothetical protein